ncbi:hypothetical protein BU24DRAFT_423508 [Aaosphaeria arxii CBS 175.79]|uniref:DUF7728 domain-containing protein n=1 Tax=Aaosphaeria arxii CBS 175.79 TaxID=1450172 RepID=A0A6A5XNW4_9PLEO|nr:uncharacterized protein BU24DRAFT_423508 [Aaosphaeria arxii CBS 175.79]KAF2014596.1 hypothetical protein BU24DRAFT_423508 [Aaosphaeria arxii CBS 175.79]
MFTLNFGIFASMALAANAILVPPNVAAENLGEDWPAEIMAVSTYKRTVALECPSCAYAIEGANGPSWKMGAGNTFLLDFEVGPSQHTLDIDGITLYPPKFDLFAEPFYVTQVDPLRESQASPRLRVTGYKLHYNTAETVSETGNELLPITFHVTSIESQEFDLPPLTINLLKDAEGNLMIASFQTPKAEEASPIDPAKECKEWPLLCKWRSILGDKIENLKGSMRKGCHQHKHQGNPMEHEGLRGKPPHTFRPGKPHPHHKLHHHAHGHHHHHRVHMFMHRAFITIFIPILIGVLAGTITYVIGMALGLLIAVVLAKVRGRDAYERIALEDGDSDDVERGSEKEAYADLPEYDAPPVYEEPAEKEVVA